MKGHPDNTLFKFVYQMQINSMYRNTKSAKFKNGPSYMGYMVTLFMIISKYLPKLNKSHGSISA